MWEVCYEIHMLSSLSLDSTELLSSIDSTNTVDYDKLQRVRNAKINPSLAIYLILFHWIILYMLFGLPFGCCRVQYQYVLQGF